MTTKELAWCELTSQCTCTDYDNETGEETPSNDCYGHCWEDAKYFYEEITKDFFGNTSYEREYIVENFRTWQGGRDGTVWVKNAEDFLYKLINRIGDFRMKVTVYEDHLAIFLAHHDASGTMRIEKGNQNPD